MIKLTAHQCRVIGVMLEKETTTPEQYPLSLNGLTNGCNQKSNREPVLSLSETEVQNVVDELVAMKQLSTVSGSSSRVNKYCHRFCNSQFGDLQLTTEQRAIICVLLLRGAQTPGELRTRTNRLADFKDVQQVETVLTSLQDLNGKALVTKLDREQGKRESRYLHLFSDVDLEQVTAQDTDRQIAGDQITDAQTAITQTSSIEEQSQLLDRISVLEKRVEELTQQVSELTELVIEN